MAIEIVNVEDHYWIYMLKKKKNTLIERFGEKIMRMVK